MRRRRNPWLQISLDGWKLGAEAASVIGLRSIKLASGGEAARAEATLMVDEKLRAAAVLQMMAFTGGLGATPHGAAAKTVAHLRRKVRANRRRLSGS